jgi:hypothetical protein
MGNGTVKGMLSRFGMGLKVGALKPGKHESDSTTNDEWNVENDRQDVENDRTK